METPRRVRRHLLLPPGWVALGFLLLLGCQALQPWRPQLKQWNVLQLTIPPLKVDTNSSYVRFLVGSPKSNKSIEYTPYTACRFKNPTLALAKLRPWHNVEFRGALLPDFWSVAPTESAVRKIIADTSRAGGVRVRFWPGTTYANLVKVLDVMHYTGQKYYWLNGIHCPTTLYAITEQPALTRHLPVVVCGMGDFKVQFPPPKSSFQQLLSEFGHESRALGNWPWRVVALLLAIIGLLNLRQLAHLKADRSTS